MRAHRPGCVARVAIFVAILATTATGFARPAFAAGPAPSGVTAVALTAKVDLSWQPVAGATAYNVYRGLSLTTVTTLITPVGGVALPGFTDTTAVNGTTYYYAVRSVVAGAESVNSLISQAAPVARSCSTGNAIVLENCFPGTAGWKLRRTPTVAAGGIEGYATASSINGGDSVDLKVNAVGRQAPSTSRSTAPATMAGPEAASSRPSRGLTSKRSQPVRPTGRPVSSTARTGRRARRSPRPPPGRPASTCCASCATTTATTTRSS